MAITVVILGFYGSQRRHVEKYALAWQANVPGVRRCVLNECSGTLSFLSLGTLKDARKVVRELKDENDQDDTVFFHVLSNRGMFVYLEVARLLPSSIKVGGVVFDSCPGSLSPWLFFKATAANEKNQTLKTLHQLMPYILFLVFAYKYGIVRSVMVHIFLEFNQQIWTRLYHRYISRNDPLRCPALFLYSKADELVTYDWVEHCAEDREKTIGRVWRKRWDPSAHVRHIYEFEDEYVDELKRFARTYANNN